MLLLIYFKITDVWNIYYTYIFKYIHIYLIDAYAPRYIVINKITTHPLPQ